MGQRGLQKSVLRHEIRTRESEEPILWDIAGHPSSWVGRSEKKRNRESGNGEQRRGRTETGGVKPRGRKLCLEEIKFGTCRELEK